MALSTHGGQNVSKSICTTESINRRTILGGLAATAALTAATKAKGADHPDAEIFRLGREFDRIQEETKVHSDELTRLCKECENLIPPEPEPEYEHIPSIDWSQRILPPSDELDLMPYGEVRKLWETPPEERAAIRRNKNLREAWLAERTRIRDSFDTVEQLEEVVEPFWQRQVELANDIMEMRAATFAGMKEKLRVWRAAELMDDRETALDAIAADIERNAGSVS
jgi:hypothetical protein